MYRSSFIPPTPNQRTTMQKERSIQRILSATKDLSRLPIKCASPPRTAHSAHRKCMLAFPHVLSAHGEMKILQSTKHIS
jgi:ABC-type antimicrobial peptide transport system ATPase subunit